MCDKATYLKVGKVTKLGRVFLVCFLTFEQSKERPRNLACLKSKPLYSGSKLD